MSERAFRALVDRYGPAVITFDRARMVAVVRLLLPTVPERLFAIEDELRSHAPAWLAIYLEIEEAEHIQALAVDPRPEARSVLADWIEEQGDVESANRLRWPRIRNTALIRRIVLGRERYRQLVREVRVDEVVGTEITLPKMLAGGVGQGAEISVLDDLDPLDGFLEFEDGSVRRF